MSAYTVKRFVNGECKMSNGTTEPRTTAHIYKDGRLVTTIHLNATTMCLPDGSVYGMDAADDQIIRAVLGDENIFNGAPAFPDHHDEVLTP